MISFFFRVWSRGESPRFRIYRRAPAMFCGPARFKWTPPSLEGTGRGVKKGSWVIRWLFGAQRKGGREKKGWKKEEEDESDLSLVRWLLSNGVAAAARSLKKKKPEKRGKEKRQNAEAK